jgi:hypothetical protein
MATEKGATTMPTVQSREQWTAKRLLAAVKKLPATELHDFQQRFAAWRGKNGNASLDLGEHSDSEALLETVRQNSVLPDKVQKRFNRLRRKREAETLSIAELKELQTLWQQVEKMNVVRLGALCELARRGGTDVKTLMRQLGINENRDVF